MLQKVRLILPLVVCYNISYLQKSLYHITLIIVFQSSVCGVLSVCVSSLWLDLYIYAFVLVLVWSLLLWVLHTL